MTPLQYYTYLKRAGYQPRTACTAVLMRFCPDKSSLAVRLRKVAKVLNKNDRERPYKFKTRVGFTIIYYTSVDGTPVVEIRTDKLPENKAGPVCRVYLNDQVLHENPSWIDQMLAEEQAAMHED